MDETQTYEDGEEVFEVAGGLACANSWALSSSGRAGGAGAAGEGAAWAGTILGCSAAGVGAASTLGGGTGT